VTTVIVDKKAAAAGRTAIVVIDDGATPEQWRRYRRVRITGPCEVVQHPERLPGIDATVAIHADAEHVEGGR